MEAQDLEKEIIGSLAGYVITVGIFLAMVYILGIIEGERFYSLLAGFFGGVGLTGWLWGRQKTKWLVEKDELEGRLAAMAATGPRTSMGSGTAVPEDRPDDPLAR